MVGLLGHDAIINQGTPICEIIVLLSCEVGTISSPPLSYEVIKEQRLR